MLFGRLPLHSYVLLTLLSQYYFGCSCQNVLTRDSVPPVSPLDDVMPTTLTIGNPPSQSCESCRMRSAAQSAPISGNSTAADVLYAERLEDLGKFDRYAYKMWKTLLVRGNGIGGLGWRMLAGLGDWWFKLVDWFEGSRIGCCIRGGKHDDYYMYAEYEEEFDIGMTDEEVAFLESIRASHHTGDFVDYVDGGRPCRETAPSSSSSSSSSAYASSLRNGGLMEATQVVDGHGVHAKVPIDREM
ncbi:hypothetical protein X943_002212 [Babesia divergens]|uniref:Uncharacterized protein n=1 Tax=Babesia divergens TaxID=32595 RepID=A0AAD9GHG5_BABDI|nr:hypothetical protein X943_002212 [Babesia divergens]